MTGWLIETLIASTLLMAFVLAVRAPVARHFGPAAAYALWLLPLARMVLPPLPAAAVPAAPLPAALDVDMIVAMAIANARTGAADEAGLSLMLLPALWLGGAGLFLAWHLIVHRRTMTRLMRGAQPLPALDHDGVEVCASPAAAGPLAAGIFVKSVVLPADWKRRYAGDELRLAMAHEFTHHRRCDISANLIALVALSLHWFNPIAHIAYRAFRSDQELACDAVVLADTTPQERHAYASALVKSAIRRRPAALCPFGAREDLKRRLRMMRHHYPRGRAGTVLVVVAGMAGLAATASGGVAAETGREVAGTTVAAVAAAAPALARVDERAQPAPAAEVLLDRDELDRAVRDAEQAHEDARQAGDVAARAAEIVDAGRPATREIVIRPADVRVLVDADRIRADAVRGQVDARRIEATMAAAFASTHRSPPCAPGEAYRSRPDDGIDPDRPRPYCVRISGQAMARMAIGSAEASLRMARRQLERESTLSAETRAEALAGIDQALAELRAAPAD